MMRISIHWLILLIMFCSNGYSAQVSDELSRLQSQLSELNEELAEIKMNEDLKLMQEFALLD